MIMSVFILKMAIWGVYRNTIYHTTNKQNREQIRMNVIENAIFHVYLKASLEKNDGRSVFLGSFKRTMGQQKTLNW